MLHYTMKEFPKLHETKAFMLCILLRSYTSIITNYLKPQSISQMPIERLTSSCKISHNKEIHGIVVTEKINEKKTISLMYKNARFYSSQESISNSSLFVICNVEYGQCMHSNLELLLVFPEKYTFTKPNHVYEEIC